jgi:hypothetical protein
MEKVYPKRLEAEVKLMILVFLFIEFKSCCSEGKEEESFGKISLNLFFNDASIHGIKFDECSAYVIKTSSSGLSKS